jgi:hypothetical protein
MASIHLFVSLLSLLLATSCVAYLPVRHSLSISSICGRPLRMVESRKDDGRSNSLESLKLDESNLSEEVKQRYENIRKLSAEADDLARSAGFTIDNDDDSDDDIDFDAITERQIRETNWSGQSDLDITTQSRSNWRDMASRKGLVVIDILALLTFAAIGRNNHGEAVDILAILGTAIPFIIGWITVSPVLGSYTRASTKSKKAIPQSLLLPWAVSIPLSLAIRSAIRGDIPPVPFIVVSMVSTFVLMSVYRFVYIALTGETSDEESRDAGLLEVFGMVGTLVKRW